MTLAIGCTAPVMAADYYVDFDHGQDTAPGLAGFPWQHAPGDPLAKRVPLATILQPGDAVHFAPGVAYRSSIKVTAKGTAAAPIRFIGDDGQGGGTRAIMHGGNPLPAAVPCTSQAACGGAPNWAQLSSIVVPKTAQWSDWLVNDGPLLGVAQYPATATPFGYDDLANYVQVPLSDLPDLVNHTINFTGQPPSLGSTIAIWSQPNVILYPQLTVFGTTIHFAVPGFVPYTDRPNLYAILNDPTRIGPGQFAMWAGAAYVYPAGGVANYAYGARRGGFVLASPQYISIEGFSFTGFSSTPTDTASGLPISDGSTTVTGLTITRSSFAAMALINEQGAINIVRGTNVTITGNSFADIVFGSGIRVSNSTGPVLVRCNSFARTGRTAVALLNVYAAQVQRNSLDDINGVHGNGVTSYLDNRLIEISDNVVSNSVRPVTMQGYAPAAPYFSSKTPPATTVTGNVLETQDPDVAAVISWGGGLANVTVSANTFVGPGLTTRFNAADTGIVVGGNAISQDAAVINAKRAENAAICAPPPPAPAS